MNQYILLDAMNSQPLFIDSNNVPHWYAIYTQSRHEKKIARLLSEKGLTNYLPLIEVYHRWSDRYQKVLTPLFSCYVFVFMALRDRFKVLQTDGVIKLVSFNGQPATIPDHQIDAIKRIMTEKMRIDPINCFVTGKKVRVRQGPLKGIEGTLVHKNNKNRFVIAIDGIRQALSIEIDYRDLEILREG
ncbi:MAG: UpxY family transcription antiterminator [candidate division KSB1 bacterium]|nr:UpxY family transcription antiterminator [candidate division KSB1 bacterium]